MTATESNGWALTITRHIAAPPEKVWDVLTRRQAEWWCPVPWRAEFLVQEWRAGGRTSVMMHGPEGEEHPHDGIFLEVTPGVRFVSTDALVVSADGQYMPVGPFMVGCWEITADAGGTLYTATARHWDEDTTKRHLEMGFDEGWGACADQLKALCET